MQTLNAPNQSRRVNLGRVSESGSAPKSFSDQVQLLWLKNRREQRRERIRNNMASAVMIGRLTYFAQQQGIAASLGKACHKIHSGVDDSPSDIAAECRY